MHHKMLTQRALDSKGMLSQQFMTHVASPLHAPEDELVCKSKHGLKLESGCDPDIWQCECDHTRDCPYN